MLGTLPQKLKTRLKMKIEPSSDTLGFRVMLSKTAQDLYVS